MKLMKCFLAGLAVSVALSGAALAETKWDMPTPYPDGNFHTKNIVQFTQDVDKATNGDLKIVVHSAGSLVKHSDIKNSVKRGIVPIGEVLISLHANESPIYGVDSVPFLASGYAAAKKLYAAQKPLLEKRLASEGLVLLFSVPWPPQGIYAKKEIKSLDDMKGLKFRTYNVATQRIAQLVGAIPTQVEAPDVPTAFSTNRVEAMITSPSTGVDSKAWDFVSYFVDTQAWIPRNIVFVSKDAFDKLSDADRKALLAASETAEERGWAASEQETTEKTKQLAANGMKVIQPSDTLKAGFAKVGQTMTAEWEAAAGADGKALLDAYRK